MHLGGRQQSAILYFDVKGSSLLWVLRQKRLKEFASDNYYKYFSVEALDDYNNRLKTFPESFRDETGSRDQVSMGVADVDFDTFQKFLTMLIDFYEKQIAPQTR